mmetsp:Transcript_13629/g.22490  ORF Transcript_13629/g.22490 Transcript_13629/m.22490 type:complete len:847 (-) Transcript_13629:130-2670(-)
MSIKLRDLIRSVRACKTAAEERAVISKECALIRTAIKEEDDKFRNRNVAKLMYIHMLGYPTHFGQMECLKLISAQTFPEKRIGYLGLTLLLTENTEVLMLVTNSLKVDLFNSNQYIVALALITIGNLATQDMARDVASDVEKLLRANNSYLRKKAALATIRLLRKEPDLIEHMSERIVGLLKDRSHGVLVSGVQLMIEVIRIVPEHADEYRRLVPSLVRLLRNFISMGYSPEHDVGGITDPFLQVALLQLLGLLGKGNDEASEHMNDVLAQVATNTETAKNAGNAILYQCVMTIMEVVSDSGLKVLAVNILGRFLLNRDNNIRYVALNTLSKVVSEDIAAVQRHRATIVDCLKDTDISIRQRALDLIFQLVNESNVETLTVELLNYLIIADSEHKTDIVSRLMTLVEDYSPSKKWRIDTIITMLSLAGNQCDESVPRTAIIFIAQAEGLQGYAVHRLYSNLLGDTSQQSLVNVGIWCIGEYGDLLNQECPSIDGSDSFNAVSEQAIVSFVDKTMRLHNADVNTKAFGLNALMKLSVRVPANVKASILKIMDNYKGSMTLELQQRGAEYSTLLSSQWDGLRGELLGKMPVLDGAALLKRRAVMDDDEDGEGDSGDLVGGGGGGVDLTGGMGNLGLSSPSTSAPITSPAASGGGGSNFLLDLDDIFGGGGNAPPPQQQQQQQPVTSGGGDLLADIFATPPAPVPQQQQQVPQQNFMQQQQAPVPVMTPTPPANPSLVAFDKNGLVINMELSKPNPANPGSTRILCKFTNNTGTPFANFVFQAAVPKYLKLEMLPPSNTTVPPHSNGAVTQEIRLINSMQGEKNIMLKLKIAYAGVTEMAQVSNFPPLY